MIRVAVIGAGHWGPNLIRHFNNHQTSVVAVVIDQDQRRLSQVAASFQGIKTSSDRAAALVRGIDAVVVATPSATHHAVAKAALEAGKHVLVEKPITTRSDHGEELCMLADKRSLVLMVGHVFIYNAAVQRVKRYIADDELGRVYYLSMVRTNLGPIRMDTSAAWDLASHDISIANYWLGKEPTSASATGGTWINPGIEDALFATLRYPGDIVVHLHASWLNPKKARDITVIGEQKMLTFDDLSLTEPLRVYDKGVTDERTSPSFIESFASFRSSVREGDIVVPKVAPGEPLKNECDHFLDCIRFGKEPLTGGREGLSVVRALEAINLSIAARGTEQTVANARG